MQANELLALVTALAGPDDRAAAARRMARAVGAHDLLVLTRDPEADVYLPVLGLRKTLPGGRQWRDFLQVLGKAGIHRSEVPSLAGEGVAAALGCSSDDTAVVLLGGHVEESIACQLCTMLPLLGEVLRTQQALAVSQGELATARSELRQSGSLMKALDEARRQVDRTLIELDGQALSLHEARVEAEEATLAKDRFLAMLGHELRNPLSPIVTALELLRLRGLWSHEHDIMQRQVGHLLRLVDDLLDISRITGGKLVLEREQVELAQVIARALEMASPLLEQRRHPMQVDVAASGMCLSGDPARLAQVFSNLLNNAAKYSDAGSPITVAATRAGDVVRVDVIDAGMGIDPDMLEGVFDVFEQQGRGLDRAQGGLGLGLAIVRNLVAQHGGRVQAFSEGLGRGSRFSVELPLSSADAVELPAEPAVEPSGAPLHCSLLLVDDNADALATLATALRYAGFDVRTAGDAVTALRLAAERRPDAALLDIGLPVMDGYELARRLRRQCGPRTHLIALTGYGQEGDRLRTEQAGFEAHLVKPVDWPDLERTLRLLLNRDAVEDAAVVSAGN